MFLNNTENIIKFKKSFKELFIMLEEVNKVKAILTDKEEEMFERKNFITSKIRDFIYIYNNHIVNLFKSIRSEIETTDIVWVGSKLITEKRIYQIKLNILLSNFCMRNGFNSLSSSFDGKNFIILINIKENGNALLNRHELVLSIKKFINMLAELKKEQNKTKKQYEAEVNLLIEKTEEALEKRKKQNIFQKIYYFFAGSDYSKQEKESILTKVQFLLSLVSTLSKKEEEIDKLMTILVDFSTLFKSEDNYSVDIFDVGSAEGKLEGKCVKEIEKQEVLINEEN